MASGGGREAALPELQGRPKRVRFPRCCSETSTCDVVCLRRLALCPGLAYVSACCSSGSMQPSLTTPACASTVAFLPSAHVVIAGCAVLCNLPRGRHLQGFLSLLLCQQTFNEPSVSFRSCGPMMLDVLFKIKDEQDHTLNFRRSCRCEARTSRMLVTIALRHECAVLNCALGFEGLRCAHPADRLSLFMPTSVRYRSLQGRHLRVVRHEHQRHKRIGVPHEGTDLVDWSTVGRPGIQRVVVRVPPRNGSTDQFVFRALPEAFAWRSRLRSSQWICGSNASDEPLA